MNAGAPLPITAQGIDREIWRLAIPAVLQTLFQTAQFFVDTKMVSEYGGSDPAPLAAMAVVGPICWSLAVIFTITSVGATAVVARRIGEGRASAATTAAMTAIVLSLLSGLLVTIFGVPLRSAAIGLFSKVYGAEGGLAVVSASEAYLGWFILFFPLRAVLVTVESSLRGAGESMLPFWGGIVSNLANIGGNAILIFGLLGAPRMGVSGAGLATALAPAFELIFIAVVLGCGRRPRLRLDLRFARHFDREVARELLRISGPAFIGAVIFHSGFIVYQVAIFGLSAPMIAAHRVAITLQSLGFLPAAGFYSSAASLSGRLLGNGDRDLARIAARRNLILGLIFTLPISATFFFGARSLAGYLTEIPETLEAAALCLQLGAIEIPFLVVTESLNGTLRGAGATRAPMVITAIGTWGIRVPGAWLLAHPGGMGLTGIWVATVIDWALRAALTIRAVRAGRWLDSEV